MSSSPSPTSTPSASTASTASTAFQLHYRKHKYTPDTIEPALLYDIQNYIPIYSRFFDITETNYNGIQLNQKYYLQNIISHPSQIMESGRDDRDDQDDRDTSRSLNHLETIIADDNGNTSNVPIFVKYSPLLDPIRYLSGKYQVQENKTRTLPKYNSTPDECEEKMLNTNNTSYVDGFFSYLTSRALHTHGVVHGVDYYGSYLCKQREFSTNVFDDIDYLVGCSFFNNYENDLFSIDYSQFGDDIEGDLSDVNMNKMMKIRNKMKSMIGPTGQDSYLQTDDDYHSMKNRINILDHISESESGICDDTVTIEPEQPLSLDVSVPDTDTVDRIQSDTCADALEVVDVVVNDETDTISSVALHPKNQTRDHDEMSDSDSSQSNSSYTTMSNDDDDHVHDDLNPQDSIQVDDSSFAKEDEGKGDGDDSGSETGGDDSGSDSGDDSGGDSDSASYDSDDEQIIVKIKDFPIQAILLEKCVSTLDRIMMTDELTKEEWSSILFQIIMTLIMYQKMFEFTHNDLHTNNVMFVETTEEFLYYFYEDQYY